MNIQLKDITVTARDGRVSHLDQVYIRGSHVRFFIVPDMLKYVHRSHLLPYAALSDPYQPFVHGIVKSGGKEKRDNAGKID